MLDFQTNTLFPRQLLFEKFTEFKWSAKLKMSVQEVLHSRLQVLVSSINSIELSKEVLWLVDDQPIIGIRENQLANLLDKKSPVFYGFGMPYKMCEALLLYYLYKELSFRLASVEDGMYLFKAMRILFPVSFVMNTQKYHSF